MNKYDVLKQTGEGAFSQVYLCKEKKYSSLMLSGIFNKTEEHFIIKVINLKSLIKKYRTKSMKFLKNKKISNTNSVNITPYNRDKFLNKIDDEDEYYNIKLTDLIMSEIQILNLIKHDNIITYFSHEIIDESYYIKMEYCNCGDLYNILKNSITDFPHRNKFNGFTLSFIKLFLKDITSGLDYLHELNIIHRDIKLHNILVHKNIDNTYVFKLSDFGFACIDLTMDIDNLTSDIDFSVNRLKQKYYKLCGTPYYMAPELILNMDNFKKSITDICYDKKIDIWSLGICLYELIFNKLPFNSIKHIQDLYIFFTQSKAQHNLNKIINKTQNNNIKILLQKLLKIEPKCRISINDFKQLVYKLNEDNSDELEDITNQLQELKINDINVNLDSWVIENSINSESWDKINETQPSMINISMDNYFKKWLYS